MAVIGSISDSAESMPKELLKIIADTGRLVSQGRNPSALRGTSAKLPTSLDGLRIDLKVYKRYTRGARMGGARLLLWGDWACAAAEGGQGGECQK